MIIFTILKKGSSILTTWCRTMNVFYEERLNCGVSNPFGVEVVNIQLTSEFREALKAGSSAKFGDWSFGKVLPQPEMCGDVFYSMKDLFTGVFTEPGITIDISSWNFSRVINTSYMFSACSGLVEVVLPNDGLDNLWNVERMFWNCTGLKTFGWVNARLPDVCYIRGMFQGCSCLRVVKLPEMIGVQYADDLFDGCRDLVKTNIEVIAMGKCISINNLFRDCTTILEITLPHWNCGSLKTAEGVFSGCLNLRAAYIDGLAVETPLIALTDVRYMFAGCTSLELVYIPKVEGHLRDVSGMFKGCTSLVKVHLNSLNLNSVRNLSNMFADCIRLENVLFPQFQLDGLAFADYMFKDCKAMLEFQKGLPLFIASNYKATIGCNADFVETFRDRSLVIDDTDISLISSAVGGVPMYFNLEGACNCFVRLDDCHFAQHFNNIIDNAKMVNGSNLNKSIIHLSELDEVLDYCSIMCKEISALGVAKTVGEHNRISNPQDRVKQRLLLINKPFSCGDNDVIVKLGCLFRVCRSAGVIPVIVDTIECPSELKPRIRTTYDFRGR